MIKLEGNTLYTIKGSYISVLRDKNLLYVTNTSGWLGMSIIFALPCDNDEIYFNPEELVFGYNGVRHRLCLYGKFGFILKGDADIKLKYYRRSDCFYFKGGDFDAPVAMKKDGKLFINDYKNSTYIWIDDILGKSDFEFVNGENGDFKELFLNIGTQGGGYEIKFAGNQNYGDFNYAEDGFTYAKAVAAVKRDYSVWKKKFANITEECLFALWGNLVAENGILPSFSSYAGNGGMWALWSWDNAYTALALSGKFDKIAYELFIMPFLRLCKNGYMFDAITDKTIDYRFTKPPVHAIVYSLMMRRSEYFCQIKRLKRVTEGLKKSTDYWLKVQGSVPFYTHGNDSGADNSTCFDKYRFITTPELYALLSEQCRLISEFSKRLNNVADEKMYKKLSERLASEIDGFISDGGFAVKSMQTGEFVKTKSLLLLRQIVAGKALSKKARAIILSDIKNFETDCGFSSEARNSEFYNGYGYWRGAVWAPDQLLFNYGLESLGMKDYAEEMAMRYVKAVCKTGPYENINGDNGKGHRCPVFSMVAGVVSYFTDKYGVNGSEND